MKHYKEFTMIVLTVLGIVFPVSLILFLLIKGINTQSPELTLMIGTLIGIVVGEYKTVFSYWMGSSQGSKNKQETLDKMSESTAQSEVKK